MSAENGEGDMLPYQLKSGEKEEGMVTLVVTIDEELLRRFDTSLHLGERRERQATLTWRLKASTGWRWGRRSFDSSQTMNQVISTISWQTRTLIIVLELVKEI